MSSQIYALRTTIGQERNAAQLLAQKAKTRGLDIKAILTTDTLRGYLFIEAHPMVIESLIVGVRHIRPKMVGRTEISELEHLLIPKPSIETVSNGDIVEIMSGPFKGSRARVSSVTQTREEVTVDLLDSPVTIPVTIHADFVKVVESAASREEDPEAIDDESLVL